MLSVISILIVIGSLAWSCILLLPWKPWSTRERLDSDGSPPDFDLSDVTVLIPARDEAESISRTLAGLERQGKHLAVIVIDDQSSDGTADLAKRSFRGNLQVLLGKELPESWVGKLWALEQGRQVATTESILLLDADIELAPGTIHALKSKLEAENLDLVSLMAELRMRTLWEKILSPAFIFFFKLLYPFAVGNDPISRLGVAAGGCVLIRTGKLKAIGGFSALKASIIDDCELAKRVKQSGGRTWIGLTHSAKSMRAYPSLGSFWNMVARTAFTQLRYSVLLLLVTTLLMALVFWCPFLGLADRSMIVRAASWLGLVSMCIAYLPVVRFYRQTPFLVITLPVVSSLYLLMTWSSAIRYWRGQRSMWKGRMYGRA
ncbi:MAG: glycosyltransferase [Verrucomicrobia bacterium]|nr:glycosyltransferase [Verrucomicrobiota bacterium]MBV8481360.1 glycosyltransferase [Verrucomicrobiota bacterium]